MTKKLKVTSVKRPEVLRDTRGSTSLWVSRDSRMSPAGTSPRNTSPGPPDRNKDAMYHVYLNSQNVSSFGVTYFTLTHGAVVLLPALSIFSFSSLIISAAGPAQTAFKSFNLSDPAETNGETLKLLPESSIDCIVEVSSGSNKCTTTL